MFLTTAASEALIDNVLHLIDPFLAAHTGVKLSTYQQIDGRRSVRDIDHTEQGSSSGTKNTQESCSECQTLVDDQYALRGDLDENLSIAAEVENEGDDSLCKSQILPCGKVMDGGTGGESNGGNGKSFSLHNNIQPVRSPQNTHNTPEQHPASTSSSLARLPIADQNYSNMQINSFTPEGLQSSSRRTTYHQALSNLKTQLTSHSIGSMPGLCRQPRPDTEVIRLDSANPNGAVRSTHHRWLRSCIACAPKVKQSSRDLPDTPQRVVSIVRGAASSRNPRRQTGLCKRTMHWAKQQEVRIKMKMK